jgi:crotonobetainyl-CoA:carnitine CoA-transferase CaiB-like acyl-CoA transferase
MTACFKEYRGLRDYLDRGTELLNDVRFRSAAERGRHQVEWLAVRSEPLRERTTAEWIEVFRAADIPAQPCHTLDSLLDDPHLRAVKLVEFDEHPTEGSVAAIRSTISIDGTYATSGAPAQPRGWETVSVLTDLLFTAEEIDALLRSGAVREHTAERGE